MSSVLLNFQQQTKPIQIKSQGQRLKSQNNKLSTSQICLGAGLACLASGGIYIATGKKQNVSNVFEKIKNTDSIMNILKDTKLSKSKFKELMFKITAEEDISRKFIKEVTSNPRNSKEYTRILNKKIGGDDELLDWMLQPGGYQEAYFKYTKSTFKQAKHPDDLIKISPNWNIWKMKEKFGEDFTLGELPQEFGDTDKYRDIFYSALNNEHNGYEHSGIKFGEYIGGGLSGKAVRKIQTNNKKYILKFLPDTGNSNLNNDVSMKSDSVFLNAQLERYLNLNQYEQGPKLRFYDAKTNSALYEMSDGVKPQTDDVFDIVLMNKKLNDLNSLGVYYNDLSKDNFLIHNNQLSFIDSGESSFTDFFKPGVSAYHFTLPNLNGRNITESAAAITLSK